MGDNLLAIDLGTGRTAKTLSVYAYSACAVLDNYSIKCWGNGTGGHLGQGNSDHIGGNPGEMGDNLQTIDLGTGRYAVQIKSGEWHACAMLDDNSVKCWGGFRGRGNIGSGSTEVLGDDPGEMGENLLPLDL